MRALIFWNDDNVVRAKHLLPWKHGTDSCNVTNRSEFGKIREPFVQTRVQRLCLLGNSPKFTTFCMRLCKQKTDVFYFKINTPIIKGIVDIFLSA